MAVRTVGLVSGFRGSGSGGDGEGAELVQEAAGPAVGVDPAGVPIGAELCVASLRVGQEVQMITRMERPTAHLALLPSRRRDRRQSLPPRKVSVVAALVAAWGQ